MKDKLHRLIADNLEPYITASGEPGIDGIYNLVDALDDFIEGQLRVDKKADYYLFSLLSDIEVFVPKENFVMLSNSYKNLNKRYDQFKM